MRYVQVYLKIEMIVLIIVGIANLSYAADDHQGETFFQTFQQVRNAKMTGMIVWLLDEREADLFCIVTSSINQFNEPEDRLLFFEEQDGHLWKRKEEFSMCESTMSLFLVNSSNDWNLVTYSLGTTYVMVHIFSLVDEKIQVVFQHSTRCAPEILDVDNDGFEEIMLCNGTFLINRQDNYIIELPESASIYRWDGTQYTLWKTVPWEDRLCEGIQGNTHHGTRE